jgi:hypothetical protein
VDRYTRVVLTVSAVALVALVFKPVARPALADSGPMEVVCTMPTLTDVNIVAVAWSKIPWNLGPVAVPVVVR